MSTWLKAIATAFIFLTRIPMPVLPHIEAEDEGRSLLCFPVVGLTIGLLLCLLTITLNTLLTPIVLAAVLTAFWAIITGGLHLDGLADSADGWLAGSGDVQKTLDIMHDPRCGSGALVAVTCVLIMKFAALTVIVQQSLWVVLLVAPILGRCIAPLLFIPGHLFYTPYVQPNGIAKNFIEHCPAITRQFVFGTIVICTIALGTFYNVKIAAIVIVTSALVLWLLCRLMLQYLGGATGDTAGAATEIIELTVLLTGGILIANAG
jgi:adenosylcobinamide-GDP ribazoletransferase